MKKLIYMIKKSLKKYISNVIDKSKNFNITEIIGDASKRKYYRATCNRETYVVMDSFLEKKNFNNFVKFTDIFKKNKIKIPKIVNLNTRKNIIIMEDLGNNLIFNKTNKTNYNKIYENSILNILEIQKIFDISISLYKKEKYFNESLLFVKWVLDKYCRLNVSNKDYLRLKKSIFFLTNNINHNNNKVVHRDYHSKNLFFKNNKTIIIDYQDAVYGSPLYDLVSLINDCYRDINVNSQNKFIKLFLENYNENNKFKFSKDEFNYNFNLLSAQRHMKASGIFCRLSIRDNRHNYLTYLNRTISYIIKATSNYKNLRIINTFASEAINNINESNNSSCRTR